jgi:hypothetical protein
MSNSLAAVAIVLAAGLVAPAAIAGAVPRRAFRQDHLGQAGQVRPTEHEVRHSRGAEVTAAVDHLSFLQPVHIGQLLSRV